MTDTTLPTQNPAQVAIDEVNRTAQGSVQWLLENKAASESGPAITNSPLITYGNDLDIRICGEEAFALIAKSLREAKATVDLICWGFDPGMELERTKAFWPRGIRYGELLEEITTRKDNPVTVRLLVWYDEMASRLQNSMPGFTDTHFNSGQFGNNSVSEAPPYNNPERQAYCQQWWGRHLPGFQITPSNHGHAGTVNQRGTHSPNGNSNLQIVLRSIALSDVQHALSSEEVQPSDHSDGLKDSTLGISEKSLLEKYPTHHQKPILIDYAHDDGLNAVGFVMGLNSITDFWDRQEHAVEDVLRETWSTPNTQKELAHEKDTQGLPSNARYLHTKPYQDYACRLVGPALEGLHRNFVAGWNAFAPASQQVQLVSPRPSKIPTLARTPANAVQIVRTQPKERDKTIKQVYYQATSYARNYIYIENQYFFYPAFAQHLKSERRKFCEAWARLSNKPLQEVPTLHLFIVIPHPESDGMVPRTQATLSELGEGQTMKAQTDWTKKKSGAAGDPLHRPSKQDLEKTLGMKVSVARLRASGQDADHRMAYREIYIHSKLMLIDDVFLTLGSANLNQRSMAVDSEINIAATGMDWTSDLRKRVFELHSGGAVSGSGERDKVPDVFKAWNDLLKTNRTIAMGGVEKLLGFLLPFEDHRATGKQYAQVIAPFADVTTMTV